MNYYNEWEPQAAAWLRELIENKLIPEGVVDERSITEVQAKDLKGFTQCHFFAGIGGWSFALQIAGIPATQRLWTGSPPCQPFSVAGAGKGKDDPRHLAPTFLNLIADCRPTLLFGEQVAAAVTKDFWIDSLLFELEEEGYASGFAVLPACSVGAPHKRDRLFFGAHNLAESLRTERHGKRLYGLGEGNQAQRSRKAAEFTGRGGPFCMADANNTRPQRRERMRECADKQPIGPGSVAGGMAQSDSDNTTDPHNGFWSDADWLGCRDGKFRPVEPGTFPLANGIPARVGRLRGYGNAIVPQVAAEFIKAFMAAKAETEIKA